MHEIRRKSGFLPEATWLVACPAGYCGTVQGIRERPGMGAIQNLGVMPLHRGRGLGTALLLGPARLPPCGLGRAFLEVTAQNDAAVQTVPSPGFPLPQDPLQGRGTDGLPAVACKPGNAVPEPYRPASLGNRITVGHRPSPSLLGRQGADPLDCPEYERIRDVAQEVYQHTFANGLTLLAERMEHVRSAALNFLVPAGCVYDPPDHLGIASVLSDLITRGAGDRDSRELTLALDNLGLDRDESVGSHAHALLGRDPGPQPARRPGNLRRHPPPAAPARRGDGRRSRRWPCRTCKAWRTSRARRC